MKTIKEITAETGFNFDDGQKHSQRTDKGLYRLVNGTLFYMYDLGRWEVYSAVAEFQADYQEPKKVKKEKKIKNLEVVTISYTYDVQELFNLIDELDEYILPMGECEKMEVGEYQIDFVPDDEDDEDDTWQGHCITYNISGRNVFFAMSNSNGKDYLVRADKNLIQVL